MKSKIIYEKNWRPQGIGPMPKAQLEPIPNAKLPALEEYELKKKKGLTDNYHYNKK